VASYRLSIKLIYDLFCATYILNPNASSTRRRSKPAGCYQKRKKPSSPMTQHWIPLFYHSMPSSPFLLPSLQTSSYHFTVFAEQTQVRGSLLQFPCMTPLPIPCNPRFPIPRSTGPTAPASKWSIHHPDASQLHLPEEPRSWYRISSTCPFKKQENKWTKNERREDYVWKNVVARHLHGICIHCKCRMCGRCATALQELRHCCKRKSLLTYVT
jgi:hypothetical protein